MSAVADGDDCDFGFHFRDWPAVTWPFYCGPGDSPGVLLALNRCSKALPRDRLTGLAEGITVLIMKTQEETSPRNRQFTILRNSATVSWIQWLFEGANLGNATLEVELERTCHTSQIIAFEFELPMIN